MSYVGKALWWRVSNQRSPVSTLDVATDPEFADRRISDEILTPPPLSEHPPPPSNDAEPPMGVPKANCYTPPLPPKRYHRRHAPRCHHLMKPMSLRYRDGCSRVLLSTSCVGRSALGDDHVQVIASGSVWLGDELERRV